ncbi:hypothetical protein PVAP13_2KG348221 [Panicum virgatum]|uniref:Uncharacterized protein n=1 Tax=Panicum virgatum TaxID=38727 RepID=A0A8T0WKZ4_PANVG|nr:hypothetical protein PVAP13_2KG348221 [Panicum virgatum]
MERASRSVSSVKPSCGSLPSAKPSCGLDEVSPADASRHLAQCIVLDIVHITEQGIDPAGKIVVPVLVDKIWCAYMFDIQCTMIYVLDPAHSEYRYPVHMEIHKMLLQSLSNCLDCFFDGWSLQPINRWVIAYPKLGPNDWAQDDCWIVMFHYARNYNGAKLEDELNKANIPSIRHSLLRDILLMEDNDAVLPETLLKCLQN